MRSEKKKGRLVSNLLRLTPSGDYVTRDCWKYVCENAVILRLGYSPDWIRVEVRAKKFEGSFSCQLSKTDQSVFYGMHGGVLWRRFEGDLRNSFGHLMPLIVWGHLMPLIVWVRFHPIERRAE